MDVQTLSVSSLAIIILARTVWELAKDRRNNGKNGEDKMRMPQRVKESYDILVKTNTDGTPLCYFPQSIEKKLDKMVCHLANIEKGINGK